MKKGEINMPVWNILLIIFLAGMIILGILLFIDFSKEPHFKIYEEVCENETPKENFLCNDGSRGWINVSKKYVLKEFESCYYFPEREICKQVEVEEIETQHCPDGWREFETTPFNWEKEEHSGETIPTICIITECDYLNTGMKICLDRNEIMYYDYILKKDLTISWLDENCEDMTPCRKDYEGNVICDNPIKTFICGDYTVETWSQFK